MRDRFFGRDLDRRCTVVVAQLPAPLGVFKTRGWVKPVGEDVFLKCPNPPPLDIVAPIAFRLHDEEGSQRCHTQQEDVVRVIPTGERPR